MSTESDCIRSGSDAVDGVNASSSEVGNDHVSETLANPLTSQAEELVAKRDGDEQEGCTKVELDCSSLAAADDQGVEKTNGFPDLERQTESVSEGLDQGIGTHNVGVETNESEKKNPVGNVEKELEPDVVCSHGANLGDVKGSDGRLDCEDIVQDRDSDDSKNQGKKVENLDVEFSASLKSDKCKDENVLGDIKGSHDRLDCEDIGEDRYSDESKNQKTKAENLYVEFSAGLESDECKNESVLEDDVNAPVTTKLKPFDSDLVWGKVRSHPWWPGQVFDPSAATEKAKKHFKKGRFLVAYFGDCTFAWNDASKIKPFQQHFAEMEKQNSISEFLDAVDCALEEVSRRIEFGLACPCISDEVYEKIKTQNIINPGIREDISNKHGGDKVLSAVSFEPGNLLEYMKSLACSPSYDTTDNLQLVCQKARLLAFYRWKGFTDLPEFETLLGSVESAPKISPTKGKNNSFERKVSIPEPKPTKQVYSKRRKTEDQDDGVFEYEDTTALVEKEMTLAEFIAEKRLSRSNENKSHENFGNNPQKKRKVKVQTDDQGSPNSTKKGKKHKLSLCDTVTPQKDRSTFGIGASILRAANQMHCSTPTRLNPCSNSNSKIVAGNNGNRNSTQTRPKARDLDQVTEEPSCTNLPEDLRKLESRDLEDSSKEQMLHDNRKETAKIAGEFTKDNNLAEQKLTDSDFKEQPSNKNCSDHSSSTYKEDISEE